MTGRIDQLSRARRIDQLHAQSRVESGGCTVQLAGTITMTNDQATISAFELVRKHGFAKAQRLSDQWRYESAPGTMTFALHNAVSKRIAEFATVGAMFRPVGR